MIHLNEIKYEFKVVEKGRNEDDFREESTKLHEIMV